MTAILATCAILAAASVSDRGDKFTDEEPISLELGGATRQVESWGQSKWNGQALSVTNGALVFTKSVHVHGGKINVGPDTTLKFARGCSLGTGLGDAGTRIFDIARRATCLLIFDEGIIVVEELHRNTFNLVALITQDKSRHGAVDPSAHGHEHSVFVRRRHHKKLNISVER